MIKYFGTDGIRGKYGESLTLDVAHNLGRCLGVLNSGTVLVGTDTRFSSPLLKKELIKGLEEANIKVYDFNIISTPALIYLSKVYNTVAVMITASHNPYQDNGLKVINRGTKLSVDDIKLVEANMGKLVKAKKQETIYVNIYDYFLHIKNLKIKKDLRVIFDLANGAYSNFAKDALSYYDFRRLYINDSPDGYNINKDCGSTHMESLSKSVIDHKANIGFAFDGDGDRLMAVDKDGKVYDGDSLIFLMAKYLKEKGKLNQNTVVLAKDVNPGVIESYKKIDIKVQLSDVGDANIYAAMESEGLSLGGETSGHIIPMDYSFTGDGLYNALLILSIISEEDKSLAELSSGISFYPMLKVNLEEFNEDAINSDELKSQIGKLKESINNKGLILVRRSGTEHLLRVFISTKSASQNEEFMKIILSIVGVKKWKNTL